jgi:hypothetical protein
MLPTLNTIRAALIASCLVPASAFAQAAQDASPVGDSPQTPVTVTAPPRQFERIQRALSQPSSLKLDEQQLRFYLEIVARRPTFAEYAKGYDFLHGPTKGGNPMSHDEFLQMVTPKEMYSSAGITASEQVQFALTNYIGQTLIRKALEELKKAKDAREVEAIRERIDRELEALTGASRPPAR